MVAVNAADQVVGTAQTAEGQFHAFLWTAGKGMQDLGTLGGKESHAKAINSGGQIVGTSETAAGETHAFIWNARTGMRDLAQVRQSGVNDVEFSADAGTICSGTGTGGLSNGL